MAEATLQLALPSLRDVVSPELARAQSFVFSSERGRGVEQFRRAALDHAVEGREQGVDLAFPAALQAAAMLLVDNTTSTNIVLPNPSSTTANLNAGDAYQIIAYGVEGSGAAGGLFGVSVTPGSELTPPVVRL